jgi:hypothetical protein
VVHTETILLQRVKKSVVPVFAYRNTPNGFSQFSRSAYKDSNLRPAKATQVYYPLDRHFSCDGFIGDCCGLSKGSLIAAAAAHIPSKIEA